ncbi:MAG: hypothetical protein LBB67_03675 [Oscillospiraceae bacterium]|nr:hypothetical protein [Oscillospiraceae bacterium]
MERLHYYIYFSWQKIKQLYLQLPESCIAGQKCSSSASDHGLYDIHPNRKDDERDALCFHVNHIAQDRSHFRARDYVVDKHEIYQFKRLLRYLNAAKQIHPLPDAPNADCVGRLFRFCGTFAVVEKNRKNMLFMQSDALRLRLRCEKKVFCGDSTDTPWEEIFDCSESPPLFGVMICADIHENLMIGLPLFLRFA